VTHAVSAPAFLAELWGTKPPGSVLIWRLAERKSNWLRSFKSLEVEGECDVYTGVGLASKSYGAHRRCPRHEVIAIPGLWADIDWNDPRILRSNTHPTIDAAFESAYVLAEPTLLVYSGFGFQAWWLFDGGPWRFRTYGEQRHAAKLAAQWQALLRSRCGYPLDYTHDLARVMRLPATLNGKRPHRPQPVEVVETGPRHERDDLIEIAGQAGEIHPGYSIGTGTADPSVTLRAAVDFDVRIAEELMLRSSMFARTWRHERPELPSLSEHDLALGSIAALAGADDQQIADVITAHRAYYRSPKGQRQDYLTRTIAKIRSGGVDAYH
jgi:hypothetical protein